MKDKLLFGTIGLLVGIVVMQWTMPSGLAGPTIQPAAGSVIATDTEFLVTVDGTIWMYRRSSVGGPWFNTGSIPLPANEVAFYSYVTGSAWPGRIVDRSGNLWIQESPTAWTNVGPPPAGPISTSQST